MTSFSITRGWLTPLHVLWLLVGVLTFVAAAIATVRLMGWPPMRRLIGSFVPVMLVLACGAVISGPVIGSSASASDLGPVQVTHWPVPTSRKVVYLTFDDGPDPVSTPYILSVLMAKHVPATFFDVGKNILRVPGPALVKMEVQEGMVVGDHSWSHPHFKKLTVAEARAELDKTADLIQHLTGVRPTYVRYPYGELNPAVEASLAGWGYHRSVYWNDGPRDYQRESDAALIAHAMLVVHPGAVILLHDTSKFGLRHLYYLPKLIDRLRAAGYQFGLIGQPQCHYPLTPANVAAE
jgi:peptidoglycan-N-acetylglucosamine deacetylase